MRLPRRTTILLVVGAALGCADTRAGTRTDARAAGDAAGVTEANPPFALRDFHAGVRFRDLDAQSVRERRRAFECRPVVGTAQLCTVWDDAFGGRLRAVVDSSGRVAALQFAPREASVQMRDESRRLANEWNRVAQGSALTDAHDVPVGHRWRSRDERWLAVMRYGNLDDTPVSITVVDAPALDGVVASAPFAGAVLAKANMLELPSDSAMESATDRADAAKRARADGLFDPEASPTEPGTSTVADCVAPEANVPTIGTRLRTYMGDSAARLAERAVAGAYPGARLVLADEAFVVGASGRADLVRIGYTAARGDDFIMSLTWPARAELAATALGSNDPARQCSAGTAILVLRGYSNPLSVARRVPLDVEAPLTRIADIELVGVPGSPDRRLLHVIYDGHYATDMWRGMVTWESFIALDPARVVGRVPHAFSKTKRGQADSTAGTLFVTDRHDGSVDLSTLEVRAEDLTTRVVRLPLSAKRLASGMALLGGL